LSKPLVLITRPAEDAHETALLIRGMGFDVMHAPSLEIQDTGEPLPDFVSDGLIFSSAHAVRAFMRREPPPEYFSRIVFAVGAHTAQLARDSGFLDVQSAHGTMTNLVALIRRSFTPPRVLVHISGADIREDPARSLPLTEGWNIRRAILYRAVPVGHIPDAVLHALQMKQFAAILFYSARSAESFLNALVRAWPQASCNATRALCLAPPVVESVHKFKLPWAGVHVSKTPDQAGMMALLEMLETHAER